jgi:predicted secreted protein
VENEYRPGGQGVGSGGKHVFVFTPAGTGAARLLFKNWREWVGESSVRELFEVTVQVTE